MQTILVFCLFLLASIYLGKKAWKKFKKPEGGSCDKCG
jgi:Na+/proline symporter